MVYASLVQSKSDFTEDEFGFTAVLDLHERVRNLSGCAPWVFTTREFRSNPESVLRDVCALMGAPFDDSMLRWGHGSTCGLNAHEPGTNPFRHVPAGESFDVSPYDRLASWRGIAAKHRCIVDRAREAYETLCTYGYLGGKSATK